MRVESTSGRWKRALFCPLRRHEEGKTVFVALMNRFQTVRGLVVSYRLGKCVSLMRWEDYVG